MRQRYESGQTIQVIGDAYGMTRERIRQILKRLGVTRGQGGVAIRKAHRRVSQALSRHRARYGCDHATVVRLNGGCQVSTRGSMAYAYCCQKVNAKARSIEFHLTFPEWMQAWNESGHVEDRGRTAHAYVMARVGDSGPYALGNIYFTTLSGNASDYQSWRANKAPRSVALSVVNVA